MQLIAPLNWLLILLNSFYLGYTLLAVVCLPLRLFKGNKAAEEAANIQYAANLVMAIGLVVNLFYWLNLVPFLYQNDSFDYYLATDTWRRPDIFLLIITALGGILIRVLFFIAGPRRSWTLSFLLLICINSKYIVSWFWKLYSNYYPSYLEPVRENNVLITILQLLFFGVIVFLLYTFFSKRKGLPYN